jgi:hypothetical protein
MLLCNAENQKDTRVHLAQPGCVETLCGIRSGTPLRFVSLEIFGQEMPLVGEPAEPEYEWCERCNKRRARCKARSYDSKQQQYCKEASRDADALTGMNRGERVA